MVFYWFLGFQTTKIFLVRLKRLRTTVINNAKLLWVNYTLNLCLNFKYNKGKMESSTSGHVFNIGLGDWSHHGCHIPSQHTLSHGDGQNSSIRAVRISSYFPAYDCWLDISSLATVRKQRSHLRGDSFDSRPNCCFLCTLLLVLFKNVQTKRIQTQRDRPGRL